MAEGAIAEHATATTTTETDTLTRVLK